MKLDRYALGNDRMEMLYTGSFRLGSLEKHRIDSPTSLTIKWLIVLVLFRCIRIAASFPH